MSYARNVDPGLVESGYSIRLLESKKHRVPGFVVRTLIGDEGDYSRGSLITITKQPGVSHRIVATEQHVSSSGDSVYKVNHPYEVTLQEAIEIAPIPYGDSKTNLVANFIGAQILADARA